jgi:hypothetical protein
LLLGSYMDTREVAHIFSHFIQLLSLCIIIGEK